MPQIKYYNSDFRYLNLHEKPVLVTCHMLYAGVVSPAQFLVINIILDLAQLQTRYKGALFRFDISIQFQI